MTASFKATVEQAALLKCLGRVHRVVERKNTIPILGNVLMRVEQDRIVFKATDLDIEVGDSVKAEVSEKGSVTAPAHLFHDIVRKMPSGSQILLDCDGSKMIVKAGRSRFTIQTLPANDFPDLAAGEMTHSFSVPAKEFHRLIDRSSFAISSEETRYYLNGIYLHTATAAGRNEPTLRAVATDGHRLAQVEMDLPDGAAGMVGIIVPRKTVGEISRLFDGAEEIFIEVSIQKIRFSSNGISLNSKLIDGTFPDYGRVIPQNNEKTLTVDRREFDAAVDRVATVSSERGRAVKVSCSNSKVVLAVNNPDSGSAIEEIEAEYADDALDIGFNSRYLADILKQVGGEKVIIKLSDPGSPTLFSGEDGGSLFVLMPMRV